MYEGDWINDKAEGNGKYIFEDGEYYIGHWKNGLRDGKGTLYYPNSKIAYKGDFLNNNYDGIGQFIYTDDSYYIGQWKNNFKHGKGTIYNKNGKIEKEGIWNIDIFIGN